MDFASWEEIAWTLRCMSISRLSALPSTMAVRMESRALRTTRADIKESCRKAMFGNYVLFATATQAIGIGAEGDEYRRCRW